MSIYHDTLGTMESFGVEITERRLQVLVALVLDLTK